MWHKNDVIDRAKEIFNHSLTDDQAREILQLLKSKHDCNIGINWEIIDVYIINYCNANNIQL